MLALILNVAAWLHVLWLLNSCWYVQPLHIVLPALQSFVFRHQAAMLSELAKCAHFLIEEATTFLQVFQVFKLTSYDVTFHCSCFALPARV